MRYRMDFLRAPLTRVVASFEVVPRVCGDSPSRRDPVPADLPALDDASAHERTEMPGTEPVLGRHLGQGDELVLFQRPLSPLIWARG